MRLRWHHRSGSCSSRAAPIPTSRSGSPSSSTSSSVTSSSRRSRTARRTAATRSRCAARTCSSSSPRATPSIGNLMELLIMINAARLGIREADHRGRALVLLRASGQEVATARADHGTPRRRHAAVSRSRSRAHDGSPRRASAGLLPHPGRPHDGDPALRAVRPRPQPAGADRCRFSRHGSHEARRASSPR